MTRAIDTNPAHGTAVAVQGRGFLLVGPSGSGKSGLALNMLAGGATLVADDRVELHLVEGAVLMQAPAALRGLIEARGLGVLRTEPSRNVPLHHVVDLAAEPAARMPPLQTIDVLGAQIDLINGRNLPNLASALLLLGRGGRAE